MSELYWKLCEGDLYVFQQMLTELISPTLRSDSPLKATPLFQTLFVLRPQPSDRVCWQDWTILLKEAKAKLVAFLEDRSSMNWVLEMKNEQQSYHYRHIHAQVQQVLMTHLPVFFSQQDKVVLYNFGCGEAQECEAVARQHLQESDPSKKLVMHLYDNTPALLQTAQKWMTELKSHSLSVNRFSGSTTQVDLMKQFPKGEMDLFVASGFFNHKVLEKTVALTMLQKVISRMTSGGIGVVTGFSPSWVTREFLLKNGCDVLQMTNRNAQGELYPFYVFRKRPMMS